MPSPHGRLLHHPRPSAAPLTWDRARSNWRAMGLRRAIHLIIALALTVVGSAEFVYLYFFAEAPRGWITVAAGLMGCAGLYWLWDEYINAPRPDN
jgi:hypothetical protein